MSLVRAALADLNLQLVTATVEVGIGELYTKAGIAGGYISAGVEVPLGPAMFRVLKNCIDSLFATYQDSTGAIRTASYQVYLYGTRVGNGMILQARGPNPDHFLGSSVLWKVTLTPNQVKDFRAFLHRWDTLVSMVRGWDG